MNSKENEQNMVYINLMDMHKSRGYINDDSIAPIENWCEIDESDDDNPPRPPKRSNIDVNDNDNNNNNNNNKDNNNNNDNDDDSGAGNTTTKRKKRKTKEGIQTALMMVNYVADPGPKSKNFVTDVTGKKRVVMMKLTRQPNNNNKSDTNFNVMFNPHQRYKDRLSENRSDTLNTHLKPFLEGRQEFEDFNPGSMNNMGKSETASFLFCAQKNFVDSLDENGNSPLLNDEQVIMLVGDNERLNSAIIKLAELNDEDAEKFRKIEWRKNNYEVLFFDKVNRLLWGIVKDEGCERTLREGKITMGKALKEASKILINC